MFKYDIINPTIYFYYSLVTMEISESSLLEKPVYLRSIRSFVRREGRMTKSQRIALDNLWGLHGIPMDKKGLDLNVLFNRDAPKILEIGFGDGHSLLKMAESAPEKDFIGVEVYRTGIGNLLAEIAKYPLSNIRIFSYDVVEVLKYKIPDNSLERVHIFFPDPWPKTRHHKRRLIQSAFVELLAQKITVGGYLHLATDWMDYANHMRSVLSQAPYFQNKAGTEIFMQCVSERPLTKYEQRGLSLNHKTTDLLFERIAC